jgi:hypothetical protein
MTILLPKQFIASINRSSQINCSQGVPTWRCLTASPLKASSKGFAAAPGRWYGLWGQVNVDHCWDDVNLDPEPLGNLTLPRPVAMQWSWLDEAFCWHIVGALLDPPERRVILGTVTRVKGGTPGRTIPHVGVAGPRKALIWINPSHAFFEYVTSAALARTGLGAADSLGDSKGLHGTKGGAMGPVQAPLLVQRGLSESLAGRFEVIPITHWSLSEMRKAFGWNLEQYIYHGGYPGAAPLVEDGRRWRQYVLHSLVETTISKDILEMRRVDNPVLLRRLFELGCQYSAQVLSLTKMLGQLQDRGNTSTLGHYLDMLRGCGLLEGLQKYAGQKARQRASSPKLQVYNNALVTALENTGFKDARQDPEYWGRLVESSVGAHLVNEARVADLNVFYWRDVNLEVDFVLVKGSKIIPIEVKSTGRRTSLRGMEAFSKQFKVHKKLLVGGQGMGLEEFLTTDANAWF